MKRIVFGGLASLFLIFVLYYFYVHSFFLFPLKIFTLKNTQAADSMLLMVPKTAKIGETISVDIYYSPQIVHWYALTQVEFIDAKGAFTRGIRLNDTFGFFPRHIHLNYKIPPKVCPQKVMLTRCMLVNTQKGIGKIQVTYNPQVRMLLEDGEGYQGDGENIGVPVEIR